MVAQQEEFDARTDRLIEQARELAPKLRVRALEAETLRRQPDETIRDAEVFMDALVPKKWGGQGLGLRALAEVSRELAKGDVSAAWALAFLMEHSWMAAHLPWEAQEEIFADRSYILAAAPLTPSGHGRRVEGGFRVSGTFRYASGVMNADWSFVVAPVKEGDEIVPIACLLPLSDLTVNDDWFMSGMAATGSASVTAHDVFVPERRTIPFADLLSVDRHFGVDHEESFLRYPPYASLGMMVTAIALGGAEAVLDDVRSRMETTRAFGGARRIDLPLARVRWGSALEKVRCAQLLYQHNLELSITRCDAGEEWSQADIGQIELDQLTVVHLAHEAVEILTDGMGSSPYRQSDALQRYRRDLTVIANHQLFDYDLVAERSTRFILGFGTLDTDAINARVTSLMDAGKSGTGSEFMRAAVLTEVGGVPAPAAFEAPTASDGEQIGQVIVAAMNPIDRTLAKGGPMGPPKVPMVVGQEGVARLGDGSKVYFSDVRAPYGAMAEQVPLGGTARVYPIPDDIDEGLAVAMGTAGITALTALQWRAQVKPGESVLVLGASSVVGQVAAQAAKLLGAGRVVGAARHEPTLKKLLDAGAVDDIVVLEGDYAGALKAAAGGPPGPMQGYDVVLDPLFGGALEGALPATKMGGRYVVCGQNAGFQAGITYPQLLGRTLFGHVKFLVPPDVWRSAYEQLIGYVAEGKLTVDVERLPLEQIGEAWEAQGAAPHRKLVIEF
ncbi:zinc-binding dehydrogenase [Blastococcus sp. SYSU D00820]